MAELENSEENNLNSLLKKSKPWNSSWTLLSALMNAIGLINIGTDLKIALFKWVRFLEISFGFIREITNFLLYPFISLFSFFNFDIPLIVKDVFFLCFLFATTIARAYKDRIRTFKEEFYAKKYRRQKYGKLISQLFVTISGILIGFAIGIVMSGVTWLGYALNGQNFLIVISIFVTASAVIFNFIIQQNKNPKNLYLRKKILEYLFTVLVMLFLVCLVNYIILTFSE